MIIQALIQFWLMMHMPLEAAIEAYNVTPSKYETVLSAVRETHDVVTGFVCVHPQDIKCIDDTCSYFTYHWTIKVNGDYLNYNSRTVVSPRDKIRLEYVSLREK